MGSDISDAIMEGLAPVYLVEITTSGGWRFFGSSLVLSSKKVYRPKTTSNREKTALKTGLFILSKQKLCILFY